MKKTINSMRISYASYLAVFALIVVTAVSAQTASAAITSQLDFGSTGSQVTELQTYLATDPSIYPSGLVTGYFGSLTQAAVQRFQTAQGIVSSGSPSSTGFGRVGPTTMARINAVFASGNPQMSFDTAPSLSSPSVQYTNTTATFAWTTNEPTRGQVYWDTKMLQSNEATGPRQEPYVSGALAVDAGGLQTNHTVTVSNLAPNTQYYFLTRGIDSTGNLSMTLPRTFRTNP